MTKRCSGCRVEKNLSEFNKNKLGKFGVHNQCRQCARLWKPSPEALKISRQKTREWNRKKVSGFTPEDFENKLKEQGYKCAICGTDKPTSINWHADHCHETKTKRGVLCQKCNMGIGLFNDNTELMEKAIMYLNQYKTNEVVS
jgi:DNA-directed RNA polymerase subunit RPC12/RpoP